MDKPGRWARGGGLQLLHFACNVYASQGVQRTPFTAVVCKGKNAEVPQLKLSGCCLPESGWRWPLTWMGGFMPLAADIGPVPPCWWWRLKLGLDENMDENPTIKKLRETN